jgi:hypothetical protein
VIVLLTIFTVPKPFKEHIGIIQRNAIESWLKLIPACEIILFGDEEGIKEVCDEFNLTHISCIKKNEFGTPVLNYIFDHVQKIAQNDLICYINADIILLSDVITTINRIPFDNFLLVGQRWNVNILSNIDYDGSQWELALRAFVRENHGDFNGGIDYLIFPRNILGKIPPFAVGRAWWDSWMIYNARKLNIPTIDATQTVMAIHQNHSYTHVPQQKGDSYAGPESDTNFKLSGGRRIYLMNLDDADWIITSKDLIPRKKDIRGYFRLCTLNSPRIFHPFFELLFWFQHIIRYGKIS